jgi:hypothetical protein
MSARRQIHVQLAADPLPMPPTRDQLLLLHAAALGEPRARRAWAQWRKDGGTIDVVDMPTFRLLPLIYRSLEAKGIDDPDLLRLKGIYRHSWVARQRLVHGVRPALEALRAAGIPTMLLKGAAVALRHYRDLGVRPMDDIDVLVPPQHAEAAIDALAQAGWSFGAAIPRARALRSWHAWHGSDEAGADIDLHWRVLPESGLDGDFWERAVAVELGGAKTLAPGPADQLLHTCVHAISLYSAPLRWIADAMAIIDDDGASVDWSELVDGARRRRVSLKAATALATVRELMGAEIPSEVIGELHAASSGPLEALNHRLALRQFRGHFYVWGWAMHRVLRTGQAPAVTPSLLQYLADLRQMPSRGAVVRALARGVAGFGDA